MGRCICIGSSELLRRARHLDPSPAWFFVRRRRGLLDGRGYDEAGLFAGLLEVAHDSIALGGSGFDRD